MAGEIMYNNYLEISLVVFMPNTTVTTNHAIAYTNRHTYMNEMTVITVIMQWF